MWALVSHSSVWIFISNSVTLGYFINFAESIFPLENEMNNSYFAELLWALEIIL